MVATDRDRNLIESVLCETAQFYRTRTDGLLNAGIPHDRIVLAFQHPVRRERGDFAVS